MIYTFWDEFFWYWYSNGFEKVFYIFWYFFLLEAPRFLVMDMVVLFAFYRSRRKKAQIYEEARQKLYFENPLVSLLVPGKNEGAHIYKLVDSINKQSYTNTEVIIVDDGSDDDTPIICRSLLKNGLIDVFLRNDVRGGKASAANLALRNAKGKYIVHLDADTSFDNQAIERIIIPFFVDKNVGAVGGNVKVRNQDETIATSLQAVEYLQTISVGRVVTAYLGIYKIVSGAFGAFRMEALQRIGGWDIGPGLDGDITVKIRKLGYTVAFEPDAVGLTSVPPTFRRLSNQRLRWNKSLIRFRMRKHSDIFKAQASFNFSNFFAIFENIFFNVILDIIWFFYMVTIIVNNIDHLGFIIPLKIMIYGTASFIQFLIVLALSNRWRTEIKLILYIPLMMFYNGYYMRIVRTLAYAKEIFFYSSYNDPWNPAKSSDKAREFGL
ncbi:MAG: glycosyltransferase [Bacteroidales bacterium]|jgi:biofilm PGA synthesis N-glycosyltransferase PgaC|nr:glycosyltransferase [Bacteroidales bacterium]